MLGIVQVAIGLIFVYVLLSILASTVNTSITSALQTRSKNLRDELVNLITDPQLQQQVLTHPLIDLIRDEPTKQGWLRRLLNPIVTRLDAFLRRTFPSFNFVNDMMNKPVNDVSWIDKDTFAKVLSSLLAEKADLAIYGPMLVAIDKLPETTTKIRLFDLTFSLQSSGIGLSELVAEIQKLPENEQQPLLDALKPIEERLQELPPDHQGSRLLPLLDGLQKVNDDAFKRALQVVVSPATTVNEAEKNIAAWFDQRMNQLSEVYKNKLTILSAIIGLVLVLLLNADTLQMARALWDDPALRETVVTAAQEAVTTGALETQIAAMTPVPTMTPTAEGTEEALAQALGAEATPEAISSPTPESPIADTGASVEQAKQTVDELISLNLPIGWEFTPIPAPGCPGTENDPTDCQSMRNIWLLFPANNPAGWFGLLLRKIIGIGVTVIAIAQGAPFWFDLLKRLVKG